MTNLEFTTTPPIPTTYSELINLDAGKVPVVIGEDGAIYIAKPQSGTLEEFFTNAPIYSYKNIKKVYLFHNSHQIAKALEGGTCLDTFLWKPKSETHEQQIRKWLTTYKYVGHTWLYKNVRRRTLENGSYLKSIEPCGNTGAGNIVNKQDGTTGDYQKFVGSNDEYEFFMWLNGKL